MTRIKICGIYRNEDARYINESAPDYAGFVFFEKSHRNVSEEKAMALRSLISPEIPTVGVFVNADPEMIKRLYEKKVISVAQLHGSEDEDYIIRLRKNAPGITIWKAFRVRSGADLENAERSSADMVLLDNGYGTGKTFDWSVMDGRPEREFILAGGIGVDNIREAINRFRPEIIDLSSSVETDRKKDGEKIAAAVKAARETEVE